MNQDLLDQVLKSPRLPSLPAIAIEVIELVQQQDVNIKQIAHTISHDPALSSKILKTVNSSFYGQAHSISTISHALVVLGLNSVKTLALGFSLLANLKDTDAQGFDHIAFWKRSLYTAAAGRALSARFGLVQQEEAFLAGLLGGLGMLAMAQTLGPEYRQIVSESNGSHRVLRDLERARLKTDHGEVGGALADNWNLPPVLVEPIRYHEAPESAPEQTQPLVRTLHLASLVASVLMGDEAGRSLQGFEDLAGEWFDLPSGQAEPLIKAVHADSVEMKRLFDLPAGELENPDAILARANEALMQLSLAQQRETTELEQRNRQLVMKATTDSLTGAANRGKFNDFIGEQFAETEATDKPVSLLFLDTDHFKKFNDTYGHPTGDRVLVDLATMLMKHAPASAMVARYGGEEFAIVMPETDRVTAAKTAEELRRRIEQLPVLTDDGETVHFTASIGVATHDGCCFARAEQLIRAADKAVYAAKDSGRNCVRVFVPRPPQKKAG